MHTHTTTGARRPIFGAAAVPFATWVLAQPNGMRKSMLLAAWLELLCCAVRLIPSVLFVGDHGLINATVTEYKTATMAILSTAQILNAIAGPLMMG